MEFRDRLTQILWLAMLTYLGFYVFGLVMGVYAPGDVPYLTIPAILFAVAVVVQAVAARRAGAEAQDDVTRETRHLRETRGF